MNARVWAEAHFPKGLHCKTRIQFFAILVYTKVAFSVSEAGF
jgi:hypothetical protein